MSELIFAGMLLIVVMLSWAIWSLLEHIHHGMEEEDEVNKRLHNVCRSS